MAEAERHVADALALAQASITSCEHALSLLAEARIHMTDADMGRDSIHLVQHPAASRFRGERPDSADDDLFTPRSGTRPVRESCPWNLTPREIEVLRLIAAGKSNKEIASCLSLSIRTVERHINNLYHKIDIRSKAEATAWALRHHLV